MVTTDDAALWSRMWSYKDHGKSWEAVYEREHPPGFRWVHESIGTNWRMLEMQAAIGRIQLARMPDWTQARTQNAAVIREALAPFASEQGVVRVPELGDTDSVHAQYKFYAYVRPENLKDGWDRDRIVSETNVRGVPCYQGSCSEVYLEKAFDDTDARPAQRLPVARVLGKPA
ncbi:DegT/DnrJ/EryC1/StrS family aminotransferase [Sphingopyxis sp.]|uniref:DegT/DnrJ/EryC1/StrS family aminotransferase n=1 Tax=Sphingopyxis sp. TaxID=1908224 RepID=UPI0025DA0287|nr:DegT/DnrJ/EryC1/StrS family aminotransferase [Sphingopyxis sp.]